MSAAHIEPFCSSRLTHIEASSFSTPLLKKTPPQPPEPIEPKFSFISFGFLCIFLRFKGHEKGDSSKNNQKLICFEVRRMESRRQLKGAQRHKLTLHKVQCLQTSFFFVLTCPHNICCLQLFVNVGRLVVGGLEANRHRLPETQLPQAD